jgi:hypothetical protein
MTAAYDSERHWRADALCGQVDAELFFPTADRGAVFEAQVAAAKRVCAGCPVRARCLDWALRALPEGIAGGLTPGERQALRRRRGLGEPEAALAELLPPSGLVRERAAAGRAAAAAGMGPAERARRFGVAVGTAHRWRTDARRSQTPTTTTTSTSTSVVTSAPAVTVGVGEGSPAATGTPLRIFTARNALAGNRALEGDQD